jgi:Protein kinase domain/Heterokaryon incompatibility protein (HET)
MWLLNVKNFQLEEFCGDNIPPYAILSHTWDIEEVTFRDICNDMANARQKGGFDKIKNCCAIAHHDNLEYVWIDTCCIDKGSSAELSEAINSMFEWYRKAKHCYVHLADVLKCDCDPSPESGDAFGSSRWFTRGWTLQELIASPQCSFYSKDWELIGTKKEKAFREMLIKVTGIPNEIIADSQNIRRTSVAQRMSWASCRRTSRPEDMAYSLMGLFGVNIPILYGEGARKAFKRLQLQIIAVVPDQTIFAWRAKRENDNSGLLADSVADFAESYSIVPSNQWSTGLRPYSMTNVGMSIKLSLSPLKVDPKFLMAAISSWEIDCNSNPQRIRIYLQKIHEIETGESTQPAYRRVRCHEFELVDPHTDLGRREHIFVLENEQFELVTLMKGAGCLTPETYVNFTGNNTLGPLLLEAIAIEGRPELTIKKKSSNAMKNFAFAARARFYNDKNTISTMAMTNPPSSPVTNYPIAHRQPPYGDEYIGTTAMMNTFGNSPQVRVSFRTPTNADRSASTDGTESDGREMQNGVSRQNPESSSSHTRAPEDWNSKAARHQSFMSDIWANRPAAEYIVDHLDEFFPNVNLDQSFIEKDVGFMPTSPTIRQQAAASAGTSAGRIVRRKSTKMFGACIEQVKPRGSKLIHLETTPEDSMATLTTAQPQRQPTFKWIKGRLIGKGTFGHVYLGMNTTTGDAIAVKQVESNPKAAGQGKEKMMEIVRTLEVEIDMMENLDHPNIVSYLGWERKEFSISIFLEYIPGGSIGSCLRKHGKFEEAVVSNLTMQALSGLSYLHNEGILHRNLKADNILLDLDGTCKLSGFGISKKTDNIYNNDITNNMQGTVFWMAPEVIRSQGQGYSAKVDIWSLGCVVLEMFSGRRPWSSEEAVGAMYKLGSLYEAPPIPEAIASTISPAALSFMYDCFTT